jgi:hypothetical protein
MYLKRHLTPGISAGKLMSTNLLLKQKEKDKENSKKGAFFYKLDKKHYKKNFHKIPALYT